jgi:hypothetical protein
MKMKRFKTILIAVAAVFALTLGAERVHAQSDNQYATLFALPNGAFVSAAEADVLLGGQIAQLKNLLSTLLPGSQAYKTTEQAVIYYDMLRVEIASGKAIPESIVYGLTLISTDAYGGATYTQLLALRTDSIGLLQQ